MNIQRTNKLNEKTKRIIYIGIIAVILLWSTVAGVITTVRSDRFRKDIDRYREQLDTAKTENSRLGTILDDCRTITGNITEAIDRNVYSIRDCIETVEILRVQVKELEDCLSGGYSLDDYYNYWDKLFGLE